MTNGPTPPFVGGSNGPADCEREKLKAVLRTNMPIGTEARLDPPFDRIAWEIWLAASASGSNRRLDPLIFSALNNLKIEADRLTKMDGFDNQVRSETRTAIISLLNIKLMPNERADIRGRPENAKAHNIAEKLFQYYEAMYGSKASAYPYGNFVNLLSQIFKIFCVDARAPSIARSCLDVVKNSPGNR